MSTNPTESADSSNVTTDARAGGRKTALGKAAGFVSAAAVLTVVVIVANATDHPSFAKGALIGGVIALLAMGFLWWRGARGGAAAHLVSGTADERERRLFRDAAADSAIAMMIAAVGGAIWSLFGAESIAVLAIVLWAGLLTWLISLAIRARRG